jgi:hypothetical protein
MNLRVRRVPGDYRHPPASRDVHRADFRPREKAITAIRLPINMGQKAGALRGTLVEQPPARGGFRDDPPLAELEFAESAVLGFE